MRYESTGYYLIILFVVSVLLGVAELVRAEGNPFAGTWNPIGGGKSLQLLPQSDGTYTLHAESGPDRHCTRYGDTLECLWFFTANDWTEGDTNIPRHIRSQVEGHERIGFILTLVENGRYLSADGQDVNIQWTNKVITKREVNRKHLQTYVRAETVNDRSYKADCGIVDPNRTTPFPPDHEFCPGNLVCMTNFCGGGMGCPYVCCPKGLPYLNHCDCKCYATSDFDCHSYSYCKEKLLR
jgi:hypothetical protein